MKKSNKEIIKIVLQETRKHNMRPENYDTEIIDGRQILRIQCNAQGAEAYLCIEI